MYKKLYISSKFLIKNKKQNFSQIYIQPPALLLKNRELLYQTTNEILQSHDFFKQLKTQYPQKTHFSAYAGFDPTADSLHLGNLVSILTMVRLALIGIKPIFLIGGATGLIGDPSGKNQEREMLSRDQVTENLKGIEDILRISGSFEIINNYEFYKNMNIIDFIRDIGKYFRMNTLLNKDTIAKRLETDQGISYTEFTYTLLQAYDFERLFVDKNCVLQVGGSDQWGNITSGIDLIRRKHKSEAFGITTNLILTSQGKKFGKSEGNALWIDSKKTKYYDVYQYLINTPDQQSIQYLKMLTFLRLDQIQEVQYKKKYIICNYLFID
ncbi:tyrosyl-tRNA synthetase, putative [Ichthyophthirius multifiliis]|uniref:Tyrosine--tRNA ligase n=1 Tax=Ichthyophthirius multifiliis TaxID=5932 RepID=G0R0S6_ICHMU|nr:tyrosyl-tRNA synthetase, putative [Ichthyophthirius multifiliis]EGR28938.1 tyrosyl-tRNA synthetase, putative [Ichthyophthirius multifiliis]|eukprot:XP_004030174.1 tyrosyl-tRNA synthetase, putative [Ichthyophthirius multifiliis]